MKMMTRAVVSAMVLLAGVVSAVEDGMGTNHVQNLHTSQGANIGGNLVVQGSNGSSVIPNVQFVGYTKFGTNQASVFTNGNGSVFVSGNAEVAGTLWVAQLNIGGGTLNVTNLNVLGALTVAGTSVGSTITASANFNVASNATVGQSMTVGQNAIVGNNLTVTNGITAGSLTAGSISSSGNATISGTIVAVGKATFVSDVAVGGSVYVGNNIVVTNNATINGTLTVIGNTTLSGNVSATGNSTVTGSTIYGTYSQILTLPTSQIDASGKSIIKISGTGGVVLTSNPQIINGVDGQVLILQGTSDVNWVTLSNGNGLTLEFGIPFKMGAGSVMHLVYDASTTTWKEISRKTYNAGSL
jgi:hypothetical protein